MTGQQHSIFHFHLANGLSCYYKQEPTWRMELFSEGMFIEGDKGRFQAAANHLIEHAIVDPESRLFERGLTRLNLVKFVLTTPKSKAEARRNLYRLGNLIINPILKHLDSERERIFEEWAGAHIRTKQDLESWGSFTMPASQDNLNPKDPSMTRDKVIHFMNQQVDWTRAFTEEELIKQTRFLFETKKLTLKVSGPMEAMAFYRMLKQTKMSQIPTKHPDSTQISYRDVPEKTDYASLRTTTLRLPIVIPPGKEQLYTDVMRTTINALRQDKEIGLYWVKHDQDQKGTNWFLTITEPKKNLMKAALWGHMLMSVFSSHKSADIRQTFEDLTFQIKEALRQDDLPKHTHIKSTNDRN